jgi:predicted MFS family arabinose efflux permease
MTTSQAEKSPAALRRRLVPLQVGIGLQGFMLWVPVEKLFMSQIGFTAASIGVMAAAYAAVVPLLEVPSGIVADRWSRNWLLVASSVALAMSSLIGGLSNNVPTYVIAAMILGVYFALNSGTVDSIVYDTVLEETGSSGLYESWIGRIRMVEAAALVVSALAGGLLAAWASPRTTYFATLPFVAVSILCFLLFREPRLHRASEPTSLRRHIALTVRVMTREPRVRRVMLLAALAALLSQAVFEFGPLWLVALRAPASAFGPYWAALVASLGVAGYLTSKLRMGDRRVATAFAVVLAVTPLELALSHSLAAIILAQTLLALLLAIVGIHAGLLVHDAVPSNIRTGVSSGVGTLGWVLFLPFSLIIGWVGRAYGQGWAGWLMVAVATGLAVLLIVAAFGKPALAGAEEEAGGVELRPEPDLAPPADLVCREVVDLLTDYLDDTLPAAWQEGIGQHLTDCDGCTRYGQQLRTVIEAVGRLTTDDLPPLPRAMKTETTHRPDD